MFEAFRVAAIGNRAEISALMARSTGHAKGLLRGVISQFDGDIEGATNILRRHLASASSSERAPIADTLAPICAMRQRNDDVDELGAFLIQDGWTASGFALRAVASAHSHRRETALRQIASAEAALEFVTDEVVRFRVLQRLARAAYYVNEHGKALQFALTSAALCEKHGAWRSAAACYSVAYSINHAVFGDDAEAVRFASLWQDSARKSGDESFRHSALVAEYESAVNSADDARVAVLDGELKRRLLPEQYTEQFPFTLSKALLVGVTDLGSMRSLMQVLVRTQGRTRGQASLCTALIALADAAEHNDDSAREHIRSAISLLGRHRLRDAAHENFFRRISRLTIFMVCVLIIDDARAERTVMVREMDCDDNIAQLMELARSGDWEQARRRNRGLLRIFARALANRSAANIPGGLSRSEFDILRFTAAGLSPKQIGLDTGRSIHTVYSHRQALYGKLGVSRATQAVAVARQRGLIP